MKFATALLLTTMLAAAPAWAQSSGSQTAPTTVAPAPAVSAPAASGTASDSAGAGTATTTPRHRMHHTRGASVVPPGETPIKRVVDMCGLAQVFNVTRTYQPRAGEVVVLQYVSG